ncbi:hypothetical protein J5N97_012592 [Dioscorea zingiberensis]|uniref:Glycosyltransferase family 18 catalytic domain-containing protein n=1 Tax=Dioscorea zingiberensis TaxID=325984 RepID=A0A9D5HHZ4_9LILI|nr:hypothetical protein J5N97_012592 [Dioscorea zingiberensis]
MEKARSRFLLLRPTLCILIAIGFPSRISSIRFAIHNLELLLFAKSSIVAFMWAILMHNTEQTMHLVVHENAYASDFHHCFSLLSNSTGATGLNSEARLSGIDIVIGKQGESCESACKLKGQSCVPSRLFVLNNCEFLQKYMSCNDACLASTGPDQPAKVVDDAPKHLNPGACLYTQIESMLSCDGSHQHTRRLCPCA